MAEMIYSGLNTGSVLGAGMLVDMVMPVSMSTARKIPSMCARNLIKATKYSTGLFLFNGVPSGAFLAQSILWVSGYPGTGCCHNRVLEIGNMKKMGNTRGLIFSWPGRRLHLP
jgi:hypothetical protein